MGQEQYDPNREHIKNGIYYNARVLLNVNFRQNLLMYLEFLSTQKQQSNGTWSGHTNELKSA